LFALRRLGSVIIRVQSFTYSVCPAILSRRSQFFSSLFAGDWADSRAPQFCFDHVDPTHFDQFLFVMYCGKLPESGSPVFFAQYAPQHQDDTSSSSIETPQSDHSSSLSSTSPSSSESRLNPPLDFELPSTSNSPVSVTFDPSSLVIVRQTLDHCFQLLKSSQFFDIPSLFDVRIHPSTISY
jgi:hypothetical protein